MLRNLRTLVLMGAVAASSTVATAASAGSIIGLVEGKWIATIDPATRKVVSKGDIKGAKPLLGIDVRPSDGMLYGVTSDGWIVTIDPKTLQAKIGRASCRERVERRVGGRRKR